MSAGFISFNYLKYQDVWIKEWGPLSCVITITYMVNDFDAFPNNKMYILLQVVSNHLKFIMNNLIFICISVNEHLAKIPYYNYLTEDSKQTMFIF